jgi:hypothetical protein
MFLECNAKKYLIFVLCAVEVLNKISRGNKIISKCRLRLDIYIFVLIQKYKTPIKNCSFLTSTVPM